MGFEIVVYYSERLPEGGYSSEIKEKKKRVGDVYEDLPLHDLAKAIFAQLARRDVMVQDVKLFEFKKTPISFKETVGGIVIKNKKFLLDSVGTDFKCVDVELEVKPNIITPVPQKPPVVSPSNKTTVIQQEKGPTIIHQTRYEIYDPEYSGAPVNKNTKLTPGKKYPIIKEEFENNSVWYIVKNDEGKDFRINSLFFVADSPGLIGGFEEEHNIRNDSKLLFSDNRAPKGLENMWTVPSLRG